MSRTGKYRWHGALLGVFMLFAVVPQHLVERYYSTWIYPKFHQLLYWGFGYLPFPGFYVVLGIACLVVLKWLFILFSGTSWWDKLVRITGHIAKWVVWFFVLWGFNYGRVPLEQQLALKIRPLAGTELEAEVRVLSAELKDLRLRMQADTIPVSDSMFGCRATLSTNLDHTLREWGYMPVKVKSRELRADMLLRFDIGGFYLPYTGEANIDAAVHYYNKPFYILHEMCHGNGFYDEGACNFVAYVAAVGQSGYGPRYSAKLAYLRYLISDLYAMDSSLALTLKQEMPLLVRYDLELLKRHAQEHTFLTSPLGELFNDRYLRLMGVQEGTRSYSTMVQLVYAWRKEQRNKNGMPDY